MSHHIHIWRLRSRRRGLNRQLREEIRRPRPDSLAIQDLERRKQQVGNELLVAEAGPAYAA
jgi:hypothetical protein